MRETKYRAWDKEDKKMLPPLSLRNGIIYSVDSGYFFCGLWDDYFIDELILLEYTGLKDKNGKEIYEGDITSIKEHMNPLVEIQKAVVTWDKETTGFLGIGFFPWNMVEVIGNIYENPELLRKKK